MIRYIQKTQFIKRILMACWTIFIAIWGFYWYTHLSDLGDDSIYGWHYLCENTTIQYNWFLLLITIFILSVWFCYYGKTQFIKLFQEIKNILLIWIVIITCFILYGFFWIVETDIKKNDRPMYISFFEKWVLRHKSCHWKTNTEYIGTGGTISEYYKWKFIRSFSWEIQNAN